MTKMNGLQPELTPTQLLKVREANLILTRAIISDPNARPEELAVAKQTAIENGGTAHIYKK